MSDRTVTYTFRGNFTSLTAGLAASGRAVGDLGTKLTAADRKGAQYRRGLSTIGTTAGRMGLVAAAGIAVMIKATADFDQAMSNVKAVSGATAAQLDQLRAAALSAGQTTKFSATEAAAGIESLLKAGVSTQDVLGGALKGSLSLAAAGELDVGQAAEIAASAMTQFKLAGSDIPHIADLLAAGAGKAQGDVSDLGSALSQAGLVAAQFGVSVDDTVGTLTAFASAGLLGSDAGTTLKQMLLKLAAPSVAASKTMQALGISAYDAGGNFVGFTALAGQLTAALGDKTQAERNSALATIFGARAVRGASILYADGAQGIDDFNKKVNDQGYATRVAAARLDNLSGDLHKFKSALDVAFIGQGEGAQGPLRNLVQDATAATNAFSKLPGPVRNTVTQLTALTAVTGGGVWFATKAIAGVGSMNLALKNLGVSAQRTTTIMGGLKGAAVGLLVLETVGATVSSLERHFDRALPSTENLTKALLNLDTAAGAARLSSGIGDLGDAVDRLNAGGLTGATDALSKFADSGSLAGNALKGFGFLTGSGGSLDANAKKLREYQASVEAVDAALANIATTGGADKAQQSFTDLAAAQGLSKTQQAELLKLMPQYRDALDAAANQTQLAGGAAAGAADSVDILGVTQRAAAKSAADQAKATEDSVKAMSDERDAAISAFDAVTQYRQALKDATAQAKKSQDGIKGNSDAALKNRQALSALAGAWNSQSGVVKDNIGKFKAARQTFIDTATAMGVPEAAAKALAKQLLDIPQSVVTRVDAQTAAAHTAINGIIYDLSRLHDKSVTVKVNTVRTGPGGQGAGGFSTSADGGSVPKDGRTYADRYLYMLAPGEEVISNRHGQADAYRADRAAGRIPGYADGGTAGGHPTAFQAPIPGLGHNHLWQNFLAGVDNAAQSLKALHIAADKESKRLDKAKSTLASATSARDSLASTIAGALGLDSAFSASAASSNPWAAGASGGSFNVTGNLNAVTAQADQELADIKSLQSKGVKGAALQALISQGPTLVHAMAQMSAADLSAEVSAYSAATAAVAAVSSYGANAIDGGAIARDQKHLDQIRDEVRKLRHEMAQYSKDNKKGHDKTANAAANSGTKAAGNAKRRSRAA